MYVRAIQLVPRPTRRVIEIQPAAHASFRVHPSGDGPFLIRGDVSRASSVDMHLLTRLVETRFSPSRPKTGRLGHGHILDTARARAMARAHGTGPGRRFSTPTSSAGPHGQRRRTASGPEAGAAHCVDGDLCAVGARPDAPFSSTCAAHAALGRGRTRSRSFSPHALGNHGDLRDPRHGLYRRTCRECLTLRGTYAGLAHPASVSHLKDLSITAGVELLPIHAKCDEPFLTRVKRRTKNEPRLTA